MNGDNESKKRRVALKISLFQTVNELRLRNNKVYNKLRFYLLLFCIFGCLLFLKIDVTSVFSGSETGR